jgi:hypothetical protein
MWPRPDGVAMRFKKFENGVFGGGGLAKSPIQKLLSNTSML